MEQHVVQTDVDRYVIMEYLAEGGMGAIFLGKKIGMGGFEKEVVLKQLLPEFTSQPEFIDLFLREAKLSAALDHANIVHTIDLVKAGSDYFIVMEYVRGGDLRAILRRIKHRGYRLDAAAAIFIAREVASALSYAHDKKNPEGVALKLIHRDVSPSNIMVSAAGEVKLADFGIAKASTHKSVFYRVKGKVGYMSPEQAYGETLDLRSDLYSLAVCLHEMLSGERLFVADLLSTPDQIYSQPVPKLEGLPGVPRGLDRVMAKALAFRADDRYQTALELQDALVQVAYQAAMLFSAPDLASHLREICGDEPSTWNKEPEEEEAGEASGDGRPGTEVLAEEAAQFSGVELTSVFTGLSEVLGPAPPSPGDATRNLKLDPRGIAYEPTRVHLDPAGGPREKRSSQPTFDFSDMEGSDEVSLEEDSGNVTRHVSREPAEPWPERAARNEPARRSWSEEEDDDGDPTVTLDKASAVLPDDAEPLFTATAAPPVEPARPMTPKAELGERVRRSPRTEPRKAPAGEDAGLSTLDLRERAVQSRDPERQRVRERALSSRDSEKARAISSRDPERQRVRERAVSSRDSGKARAISSRDPERQRVRDHAGNGRGGEGQVLVEPRERPDPAPRRKVRGDPTGRRRDNTALTDQVGPRRTTRNQRLLAVLIAFVLLVAGAVILAVGLTGPSLDDPGKGTPKRDPLVVPWSPDGSAVRSSPIEDARPGLAAVGPDRGAEAPADTRGVLKVTSTPPGASVHLDRVLQCETPCTIEELEHGRVYLLSIRRKNYVSWSSLIDLHRRRRVTVNAFLTEEPDSRKVGYLLIQANPVADVHVDGKEIGRVSSEGRIPLPPGQYEITLSHPKRVGRPRFLVAIHAGQTVVLGPKRF